MSSPRSIRVRKNAFCSSVPWAMIVGPTIWIPTANTDADASKRLSSWAKMRASRSVPPRPPYSTGHAMPAQPLSNSVRCHAAPLHVRGLGFLARVGGAQGDRRVAEALAQRRVGLEEGAGFGAERVVFGRLCGFRGGVFGRCRGHVSISPRHASAPYIGSTNRP